MLSIGAFARLGQVSPRTLRHYDQVGLLRPERVDVGSGYRFYAVGQLRQLHRIVALRDLGFSLEQIHEVLAERPALEQFQGMLRLRRAQLEQTVGEEQDRLRRIEAHLRALEKEDAMDLQVIVIKQTQPLRAALATERGLAHPGIGAAFGRLLPQVTEHLRSAGARPGISVASYDDGDGTTPEGGLALHAGFEIGDQDVTSSATVQVLSLPVVEVASAVYRGGVDGIMQAWEDLVRWIDDSGYRPAGDCRELYLEWHDDEPERNVIELQQPIAR
jgi:DNA-binding transcriptional MerR regulator